MMSTLTYDTFQTPAGPFTVVADENDVVHASGFTDDPGFLTGLLPAGTAAPAAGDHATVEAGVAAYFAGDLGAIDGVAVSYRPGGPFRRKAWDAMRAVKPGTTISYTELAATAGNPKAVRAAGSACAANPIALFVPCHRIIRSDGSSHGFLYGLECKATLLAHEKTHGDALGAGG
jgi:methylated-DNA-[protein]-cysteine S-methyltransferase